MDESIYVIYAHFEAKEGNAELVKSILTSLIAPTQQEKGCLKYELYTSQSDHNKFMLYEYWQNEDAHSYHMTMYYVQKWQAQKKELLANYADFAFFRKKSELFC